jgi:putative oxidoreductase
MLKFVISGEDIKSERMNIGLVILRIFVGLGMAFGHGINKLPVSEGFIESVGKLGFPIPGLFAWSAGIVEFFGGILLALGLLTRPSSFFLVFTMAVAAFIRHADDPFSGKEKALLYMMVFLFFLFTGSGKYALDRVLRERI